MKFHSMLLASAFCVFASTSAFASPIDIVLGDVDGFGFGCSDTGTCTSLDTPPLDNRSAGEAAATDGTQFTDAYSALFVGFGPNSTETGDILIPFSGQLTSATLSFAAGDFQSDVFGALSADINGVSESFFFADGRFVTDIHSFTLSAAELAAANLAGEVDLHLDRGTSGDFIAFDWFELKGTTGVPEPITLSLFGAGLAAIGAVRRRKHKSA